MDNCPYMIKKLEPVQKIIVLIMADYGTTLKIQTRSK